MKQPDKSRAPWFRQFFFNQFGRLRSGWRFAVFLVLFLFVSGIFGIAARVVALRLPTEFNQNILFNFIIINFVTFSCALIVGWLCGKFLEGVPRRALGASFSDYWLKYFFYGALFGTAAILLACLFGFVFGGLSFQFNETANASMILTTLGATFVLFIVGAAAEEALFHGYLLQTFARARLAWFAVILTSVFFGTAHLTNPSATWISTSNTALAGVLFAVAYLKTRTLWCSFGLHLMWNWVQGSVLGITVSGLQNLAPAPLFQTVDAGPAWLTGGHYGIEGGFACTISLIITILAIWFSPILKPTETMLLLTSEESRGDRTKEKILTAETASNQN